MKRLNGCVVFFILFIVNLYGQVDHPQVDFIKAELDKTGLKERDIYITDHYTSRGITHTYFKESINGIPIYNSRGGAHYKHPSQVFLKESFIRPFKGEVPSVTPKLSAAEALTIIADVKNYDVSGRIQTTSPVKGVEQKQVLVAETISLREVPSKLEYFLDEEGKMRLVWLLPVEEVATAWFTNYLIDVNSGEIVKEVDWTVECKHGSCEGGKHNSYIDHSNTAFFKKTNNAILPNSYEVFAWPLESPNFGGRTTEVSPWLDNPAASPNGWHTIGGNSYTTTRGNNTDTYIDDNNSNSPTGGDAARADGGATLDFSFPLDLNGNPSNYKDAAITNTFYWTNLMHDVWYNYGFDEASGNFQEENYTANGVASDYVRSEAQDGGGTCNANFGTPPDGSNPRMQMYLCTRNGQNRDGDYDNAVIAHEYAHGVSNRLTGGPAASGCLSNQEQMGEGWSDYFGMVMTIEAGDAGPDARGMGTWLFGEGPNGPGIRPFPYSTDFGVNPMTYNTIKSVSVPHGVGSVWCTMLWDLTWALIDEYGFDPDIYDGTGGNNIAMDLVMEGMKLQVCSPGFVDGRNAILEADLLLNGGANACLIWNVFAARGLGYSATQGSSGSRSDGDEAFDLPPSCSLNILKSTPTLTASESDQITYQIIVENNLLEDTLTNTLVVDTIPAELFFVSATDGGIESSGIVSWPLFTLLPSEKDTFEVVLEVDAGITYVNSDFYDDIEGGTSNWSTSFTGSTNWSAQSAVVNSGTSAWFAPDNSTSGTAYLDLAFEIGLGGGSEISFFHQFDTENNWDGGQVFISIDGGSNWIDLGPNMIANGYNNIIFNSVPGFSGNSGGFINTVIDLNSYEGQNAIIRFQMNCDEAVGGNGWWIDDIAISNLTSIVVNQASVESGQYSAFSKANGVELLLPSGDFVVTVNKTDILCNGATNGQIMLNPEGGNGTYTYAWNDGATTQDRANLPVGVYRVSISDGPDTIFKVGIITEPSDININFDVDNISNGLLNNGSINAEVSGGTGDYTYLWSTGDTLSAIDNLTEGMYVLTITDENNCVQIDSVEVIRFSCDDDYFDSGGPSGEYSNNEDITMVICSDRPNEDVVLTFNSLNIESTWDALYVYNGNSINSPIFDSGNPATQAGFPAGGYYGSNIPGPFVATNESGCITLRFRSDQFVTESGWDIDIACATSCAPEVMNINASGYGSLKQQILCADPVDTILIGSNIFADTIILDSIINIDKNILIDPGIGNEFDIFSNQLGPIFTITSNGILELNNLALRSGEASSGGAVINNGLLKLGNVDIKENVNTPDPQTLIINNGAVEVLGNSRIIKN